MRPIGKPNLISDLLPIESIPNYPKTGDREKMRPINLFRRTTDEMPAFSPGIAQEATGFIVLEVEHAFNRGPGTASLTRKPTINL